MIHRRLLGVAAGLALACAGQSVSAACGAPPSDGVSLLALGDTGLLPPPLLPWLSGQRRVGRALEEQHRERPVQALVFLGDLFYPEGLTREEFTPRLRENLVAPYCHFLDLTPQGRRGYGDWCHEPRRDRAPVPVIAVLGNHDMAVRESAREERNVIPGVIANWRMPREAEAYELPGGVSLVAFESGPGFGGRHVEALVAALRASRGPWRIVAAHHPIVNPGHDVGPGHGAGHAEDRAYYARAAEAIARSGVPVHLFLAGHEHNLQVLRGPGAALHVVAGGGAEAREIRVTDAERLFAASELGFARVDASGAGAGARLRVALWSLGPSWLDLDHVRGRAHEVACYEVGPDGSVR